MAIAAAKPFNQRLRIIALRLFFVLAFPLIIFTRSIWAGTSVAEILEVIGVFLIVACVIGRFWAILYIGAAKNQTVMQDGPYSFCRHPLYLFSTLGTLGLGMLLGSFTLTLFLGVAVFYILTATAKREEAFLRGEFGPNYDIYAARVPRILPDLSLYQSPATVTASIPALRVTFADALVFLSFIPLVELLRGLQAANNWPAFPLY